MPPSPGLARTTLRQVVQVTLGGSRVRLHFSNEYGASALTIRSVHCALSLGGHSVEPSTDVEVRFGGQSTIVIAPGGVAVSDPFEFSLRALSNVAVSIVLGEIPERLTGHPGSRTTSFFQPGDCAQEPCLPTAVSTEHWYLLSGLDVAREDARSVVVLGDSIADGRGSTTNGNDRWPNVLALRFQEHPATSHIGVLNQGIGGNAVIRGGLGPTAVARFERDVLGPKGVKWLVVACGVNDIGLGTPDVVDGLIRRYEWMIRRAHAAKIRVFGMPLLPFKGHDYFSQQNEGARQAINQWIRAIGHFDACLDVEPAVWDPISRDALLVDYHSGDGLHLNPLGYERIARAIDLVLFLG